MMVTSRHISMLKLIKFDAVSLRKRMLIYDYKISGQPQKWPVVGLRSLIFSHTWQIQHWGQAGGREHQRIF